MLRYGDLTAKGMAGGLAGLKVETADTETEPNSHTMDIKKTHMSMAIGGAGTLRVLSYARYDTPKRVQRGTDIRARIRDPDCGYEVLGWLAEIRKELQ